MQKTAEIVNSSNVAPISNVALCLGSLRRIMDRPQYLPGISVFYGPSGYGKSTAASVAVIRNNACCVQVRSLWTKKNVFEAICKGLGLRPGRTLGEMLDQIAEELALSGRPLIIDEADYLVTKGNVELIRLVEGKSVRKARCVRSGFSVIRLRRTRSAYLQSPCTPR